MKLRNIIAAGILIGFFVICPSSLAIEEQNNEDYTVAVPQIIKRETNFVAQAPISYEEVSDFVYTIDRVNIRSAIGLDSEIFLTAATGTKLQRTGKNVVNGWDRIRINDCDYYISNDYITTEEPAQIAKTIEEQIEDHKISMSDLRYMSAIIWAEAGTQCEAGQKAVGIVVMNRVKSEIYKDTVYEVIHEPYQFSPVKDGSFIKALNRYDSGEMPECVISAAKYALQGNTIVNYNNKIYDLDGFFCFKRKVKNYKVQIQDHQFK